MTDVLKYTAPPTPQAPVCDFLRDLVFVKSWCHDTQGSLKQEHAVYPRVTRKHHGRATHVRSCPADQIGWRDVP